MGSVSRSEPSLEGSASLSKHRKTTERDGVGRGRHRGRSTWSVSAGDLGLRAGGVLVAGTVIVGVAQDPSLGDRQEPGAPVVAVVDQANGPTSETTQPPFTATTFSAPVEAVRVGVQAADRVPASTRSWESSRSARRAADDTVRVGPRLRKTVERREDALTRLAAQADVHAQNLLDQQWEWPLTPVSITATFGASGRMWSSVHTGVDFDGATGDPIRSITGGQVVSAGFDGPYGYKTVVVTDDGDELWYCHQSRIDVEVGDRLSPGQTIGTVGSTGNVTGSHLHLEFRPGGGEPVDPMGAMSAHGLF